MIKGTEYINKVKEYFSYLLEEFDFELFEEKIRGNAFYDVKYRSKTNLISISYENIENYFLIMFFSLENGEMPSFDDNTKAFNLNKLNKAIIPNLSRDEITINNEYFNKFLAYDKTSEMLLKSAKELRLCLKNLTL